MEEQIIDGENFRNGEEGYGYKEICMKQFSLVVRNSSQEMREGISIYSHVKNIEPEVIRYFPDTRKQYIRSLECLYDILQPKFDDKMKEDSNIIIEEIKKLSNEEVLEKRLDLYRNLFQAICFLLERLNWLGSSSFEE